MEARFGAREVIALTDRELTGAVDDPVLQQALQDADAEISGYLVGRYTLPFAAVPAVLVGYACDIARYRLTGTEVTCTDDIESRYNKAVKFLTLVGRGDLSLGIDVSGTTVGAPAENGSAVRISAGRRRISRDTMCGYE